MTVPAQETVGILVGNAFPLSLVRRRVVIEPQSREMLRAECGSAPLFSFWGHSSTLKQASEWLGFDLTPKSERPALSVDTNTGHPRFCGATFTQCWVISPHYKSGFRPAIGEEVVPTSILDWRVLKMTWES